MLESYFIRSLICIVTLPSFYFVALTCIFFRLNAGGSSSHNLLIYTRFRSGSSFTGSLFSHHPKVYYLFETIRYVQFSRNETDLENPEMLSKRMQDVFDCRFAGLLATSSLQGWFEV